MPDFVGQMSAETVALIAAGIAISMAILVYVGMKFLRRFKREHFIQRWNLLQKKLPDKSSWREAIIEADDLLDEVMKKKKIKGNTMGERLVNAREVFSDNNAVWYGHKLRKKLDHEPDYFPKKQEVKHALLGLRGGLKDMGAM